MKKILFFCLAVFLMPYEVFCQQKCFSDSLIVKEHPVFWGISKHRHYYFRDIELYPAQVCQVLHLYGDTIAKQYYHKSDRNGSNGTIIRGVGIITTLPVALLFSAKSDSIFTSPKQAKSFHKVGAILLLGEIVAIVSGTFLVKKSDRQYDKAIESYNTNISKPPQNLGYLEIKQKGLGVGLIYNF